MYKNSVVRFIIGIINIAIPFKVGMKQGDSTASVFFLFIIMAFAESLEKNGKNTTYTNSNSGGTTTHHV